MAVMILLIAPQGLCATQTIPINVSFITPVAITGVTSLMLHTARTGGGHRFIVGGNTGGTNEYTVSVLGESALAGFNFPGMNYNSPLLVTGFTISGNDLQSVNFVTSSYLKADGNTVVDAMPNQESDSSAVCKYDSGSTGSCAGMTGAPPEKGKLLLIGVPTLGKNSSTNKSLADFHVMVLYN
jgi:hypothetical protein